MGERAPDEPLPAAIEDAVAAAIEDGATMDEIVARVRPRDDDCSPSAEGRWAERMDGLICLQREAHRFAEEWERMRDPRAEGLSALIAIETLRTLVLSTLADLSKRPRSRCRRRTSLASRSRSTVSKAPTGSASSASRRRPMPPPRTTERPRVRPV